MILDLEILQTQAAGLVVVMKARAISTEAIDSEELAKKDDLIKRVSWRMRNIAISLYKRLHYKRKRQ